MSNTPRNDTQTGETDRSDKDSWGGILAVLCVVVAKLLICWWNLSGS
jgi:hypothetical protein